MSQLRTLVLTTMTLLILGVAWPSGNALAQQKTLQEQLIGTWTYVSVDAIRPDGSRVPMFGSNPQGLAIFESNGRYVLLTARPGQPRFASNNRMEGTPEEYKGRCARNDCSLRSVHRRRGWQDHYLPHRNEHVPKLERDRAETSSRSHGGRTAVEHRCVERWLGRGGIEARPLAVCFRSETAT